MTPYYQDDYVTIYHGDCLEWLESWQLGIGLVLTDPPYGINYDSRHNSSWHQRGSKWMRKDRWRRPVNFPGIIGDDKPFDPSPWLPFGRCGFFGGNYCADNLPPSRCWVVWDKNCDKTPSKQADCEMVWTNFGKPARVYRHLWRGIIREGEENISREPKQHPHQKPLALLRFLIEYSETTGLVLDPFAGSGSTLIAAKQLNRPSIGIEIDERYCEIAASRLTQEALPLQAS